MADGYAILLEFGAQPELVRLQSAFSAVLPEGTQLTDPATFHITLAYAMGEGDVEQVREWLNSAASALQFAIVVDGLRVFDTPSDGYAFYLNVRNMGTLADYQGAMWSAMDSSGFAMSEFSHPANWQPHITIGYSDVPAEKLSPQMWIGFVPPVAVMPTSIRFYTPDETVIAEVVLKAARSREPTRTKEGRVISRRNFDRLRAIQDALRQILEDAKLAFEDDPPVSKTLIMKSADGRRYIGMISSNPYRDRDGEFVAQKALEAAVDAEWRGGEFVGGAPVLFWHEGEPIGDIIWADTEQGFLLEIAKERPTAWAKAVLDMIESTPIQWGVSIGFKTRQWTEKINPLGKVLARVFHKIRRMESSILPRAFAANPHTRIEVKKHMANPIRFAWLKKNAPELAAQVEPNLRKGAASAAAALNTQGVERKEVKDVSTLLPSLVMPDPAPDEDEDETLELEAVKALDVEMLTEQLVSMVSDVLGEQTPADLPDRVAALIGSCMTDEGMTEEGTTDELAVEAGNSTPGTKAAKSPEPDPDEDADEDEEPVLTGKAAEQLVTLLEQLVDGQAFIGEVDTRLKSLEGLAKLPDRFTSLEKRIGRVEKSLSGGPRAASTAHETEIDEDDADLVEGVKEKASDEALLKVLPGLFK